MVNPMNQRLLSSASISFGLIMLIQTSPAIAQIIPDATLGNDSSSLNPNGIVNGQPALVIEGGVRRTNNLFHSLREFNVGNNQRLYFTNPLGVQTILVRVTGTNQSSILGTLGVNGNANLFLLNPNGIEFGRNARFDLRGSFVGTTATGINLSDGSQFSAIAPQLPSLLAINLPIGLQFGPNSGRIAVQGNGQGLRRNEDPIINPNQAALRVPTNQTLALVGSEITIAGGTLKTAGGRIELGSVAAPGVVGLTSIASVFALNYAGINNFRDIRLTRAASVDASGANGGSIQIQGRQVILQDGTQIETSTLETGSSGSLRINATNRVELSGSTADNPGDNRRFPTSISSDNREGSKVPNAIVITTKELIVRGGARISASTAKAGVGGNITVDQADLVQLSGTGISQGGVRSSAISVQTRGTGNAGELTINTKRLLIQFGAEASASTFGAGDGGKITVNATEQVELRGTSVNGQLRSELVTGVGNPADVLQAGAALPPATAIGKGGDLTITTPELRLQDQAAIVVSSRNPNPNAQGAGTLTVNARMIKLDNQSIIAAESLSGEGGIINLNLTPTTPSSILLLRHQSRISATAGNDTNPGNGGNINITTPFILAIPRENSDITANAFTGNGGKVTANANSLIGIQFRPQLTELSDITVSSNRGNQGAVILNTPDIDPSRGLTVLPTVPIDVAQKIDRTCNPNATNQSSSFTTLGSGGLPANPSQAITPNGFKRLATLPDNQPASQKSSNPVMGTILVEAQKSIRLANGKIRFQSETPETLTVNPRSDCLTTNPITH
jgi:filamentous hemagglutinin family protein